MQSFSARRKDHGCFGKTVPGVARKLQSGGIEAGSPGRKHIMKGLSEGSRATGHGSLWMALVRGPGLWKILTLSQRGHI